MAALRSAPVFLIQLLVCSSESQTNITVELGQNMVFLPCKVLINNNNKTITAVEWIRPDLYPDYVLLYRDERLDRENQHPSYKNRVNLQDKEMKDGDVSLILKNVMKNDTGTYKCLVFHGETNRRKRSSSEPISIINLEVRLSGDKDGGNMVGVIGGYLGVVGVILLHTVVSVGCFNL